MTFSKKTQILFIHVFLLFFLQVLFGQTTKPQKVLRIVYESHPNEWYIEQATLWKKEIDKNPTNTEAWYNYYNANRYANYIKTIDTKSKKEKLNKIIEDMSNAIPETYEYYLLSFWNTHNLSDISLIEKAYKINPDRPDTYYPFIDYFEMRGEQKQAKEFYTKLYKSNDIAPWLLSYNYNVLMSMEKNAILFTNGDNDTYPAWMMQHVLAIREDVSVINIPFSATKTFLKNKFKKMGLSVDRDALIKKAISIGPNNQKQFSISNYIHELTKTLHEKYPEHPLYFALTVNKNHFKPFNDDLYIVGLAYRYSTKRIDNFAILKKNLEEKFRLDYLTHDWYNELYPGETNRNSLHMNYAAPVLMLMEHYKTSDDVQKVEKWKALILDIAKKAGRKDEVVNHMKDKGL